jgi:hypothetical protein
VIGDPARLAGRCVIFARNASGSDNPFNPQFPALAVAADPSQLLEILSNIKPNTDDLRDGILTRLRESKDVWSKTMFGQDMYRMAREIIEQHGDQIPLPDNLKEQLREEMAGIPDEKTGKAFHGCFVPLPGFDPDVIEPYKATCDVLRAPEVPSIPYAGLVLSGYAMHYLAAYFQQRESALDGKFQEEASDMPSFHALPRDQFLALLDRKVSELMYARETGSDSRRLLRDLRNLTKGTYFVRDVLNLCNLLETKHPGKIQLMGLYLQRIHLLVAEKYEEIGLLDRKIRELDQQAQ